MAEVAAHHRGRGFRLERDQQVASAAAQIERAGVWALQDFGDTRNGLSAPKPVEIKREYVVGEIVARGDAAEHGAHPSGSLLLGGGSGGRGAVHARADPMAESTAPSVTPETTSALMRTDSSMM